MISGKTKIYGIFGYPVEHTFSPGMHNAAFKKLNMNACYVPFEVPSARLEDAARAIIPLNLQGMNITVPHKERIIPFLDELSNEARLIGAVNTIEVKEGRLIGHNTDGRGFLRSLHEQARFKPKGKRFLVIGSGGAARAVVFSLALAGASAVRIRDIDSQKADALAQNVREKTGVDVRSIPESSIAACAGEAECLINATPLGLKKNAPLPLPAACIEPTHLVYDLVYNPPETSLLKAARAKKAKIAGGLGMLLYQGVIAFEIWTRKKAPASIMKAALLKQLKK